MPKGGARCWAGRHAQHEKTGSHYQIDIRRWMREGFLKAGRTLGWGWTEGGKQTASIQVVVNDASTINIQYRMTINGDQIHNIDARINLAKTTCYYGNTRTWFTCPSCRARSAILYIHRQGPFCRRCIGLRYNSQSEDRSARLMRKARKIERKLGAKSGDILWRPKGMHQKTFDRLRQELYQTEAELNALFCEAANNMLLGFVV